MNIEEYTVQRIEQLCAEKKYTRYRLAQVSGLPQSSISNIVNRKSLPGLSTLQKLCGAFDITLAQFFTPDGPLPDLTLEQKKILEIWGALNNEEKRLVTSFLQGLKHR
ncbi:MAG: helix-turn-helix transcriptional regulator [Gemmiger sp.]|nr:helix-turn-helix transcriptional regulator [Gemmiger sp.]